MSSSLKYYQSHGRAKNSARDRRIDAFGAVIERLLGHKYGRCKGCGRFLHYAETVRWKRRRPAGLHGKVICLFCFERPRDELRPLESVDQISEPMWDGLDPGWQGEKL